MRAVQRFKAKLESIRGGGHFVVVPPAVAEAAGLQYGVRVRGTVGSAAYRSSLMKYSGIFHMGVHKATMAAAGVQAGDVIDVQLEIDDQPLPADTVPKDLQKAIDASADAKAGWAASSPSHRREYVKHVTEAKKPETRAKRIVTTVAALVERAARTPARAPKGAEKLKAKPKPRRTSTRRAKV